MITNRHAFRVVVFYVVAAILAYVFMTLLLGCPPPRPVTGPECATSETRKNCGLCSSDPACAWCASAEPTVVGCFDRSREINCIEGQVLRIAEACEAFPDEQVYRED